MRASTIRHFSAGSVQATETQTQAEDTSIEAINKRVGADMTFNENKHGYVLAFPWNFEEVINEFENEYKVMSDSSYWTKFLNNTRSVVTFNNLFREFH